MTYFGQQQDIDNSNEKLGVLLVNLGTPDRPDSSSLRKYLSQFLMDPRVIELPAFFRWLLVKGVIINFRASKSAAKYRKVWTDRGSPLLFNTQSLASKVESLTDGNTKVDIAMRYGSPSIESKINELHQQGIRNLTVIPLYPQYSGSTTGSVFDELGRVTRKLRWVPNIKFLSAYYQQKKYIDAISDSIRNHWQQQPRGQKLVMSFHGVPQQYSREGDPYQHQCELTAQAIAQNLSLQVDQWLLVFQSRFGAQQWLQPYCDETLKALARQGVKSVDVVCPGFSADCLETLEEIDQENRNYFLQAGGISFSYIACLNDSDDHVQLVKTLIAS